ncbi:MAG: DUF4347 domain-containing protein [Synechococcus sp.]
MNADAHLNGQETVVAANIQEQGLLPSRGTSNSLVVVDSSVENAEQLIADVDRNAKVIYLDGAEDGIFAITDELADVRNVESIHILSHGDTDEVQLGSSALSSENIGRYQDALESWRASLTDDADILFYGCNIAGSLDGKALVNEIDQLTGADIAASTDLTGSSVLGGDWDLEYATGEIDTKSPLSAKATESYESILQRFSHDFNNGSLSGKFALQYKAKHGVNVVDNPQGSGKVVRFDLRRGDPKVSNKHRAELVPKLNGVRFGQTYTYEFKNFIPNDWKNDGSAETIAQWHGRPDRNLGEPFRRAAMALRVKGGRYALVIRSDSDRVTNTKQKGTFKEVDPWSGNLQKGRWVSWRFQIKWSHRGDGFVRVFQNGKQVLNYNGANSYNDAAAPYMKFGIYKPDWTVSPGKSSTSRRVLYYDDIKFTPGATSSSGSLPPEPSSRQAPSSESTSGGSGGRGGSKLYQAESARRSGGISLKRGNGSNGRYADFTKKWGQWIEWDVNLDSGGLYNLDWRYALGNGGNRPLQLTVNGKVIDRSLDFRSTGSWSRWRESSKNRIRLSKGRNRIRLRVTGSEGANIDYLKVEPA